MVLLGISLLGLLEMVKGCLWKKDFMKLYPKKSIAELNAINEDGIIIIMGTDDGFIDGGGWWYAACRCHRLVIQQLNGFFYCVCYCSWPRVMQTINPQFFIFPIARLASIYHNFFVIFLIPFLLNCFI